MALFKRCLKINVRGDDSSTVVSLRRCPGISYRIVGNFDGALNLTEH